MSEENIKKSIGKRIAECRKKKGVLQAELAEKLGKSQRTVQAYESGETDISVSVLEKISKILGVPLRYLISCDYSAKSDEELLRLAKLDIAALAENVLEELNGLADRYNYALDRFVEEFKSAFSRALKERDENE